MKFKPTDEQQVIIDGVYEPGEIVKITAYAGTGKTSTLELLARKIDEVNPNAQILYLAFNKTVAREASSRFPDNVIAKTIHSLAYAQKAKAYRHKLCQGDLRARLVAKAFAIDDVSLVKAGLDALKKFLSSTDVKITSDHIESLKDREERKHSDHDVIKMANRIWDRMCDEDDEHVEMTHDGYLKLYHLDEPQLEVDFVFLDEAQDSNPVTTDIVMVQKNAVKVLVGDPHQQIYSWRGAQNAMKQFKGDHNFYLTKSFRFSKSIALIANILLMYYKGEKRPLQGLRSSGEVGLVDQKKGPVTILGRTNSGIFEEALRLHSQGYRVSVVGGSDGLKIDQLRDAYRLFTKQNESVQDVYMQSFEDFDELEEYGKEFEDPEAKSLTRLIRKHPDGFHLVIDDLVDHLVAPDDADYILSTAHKAKGLEWNQVKLLNDFVDFFNDKGQFLHPKYHDHDEINLIYVAATRAMLTLQINEELERAMVEIKSYMASQANENKEVS